MPSVQQAHGARGHAHEAGTLPETRGKKQAELQEDTADLRKHRLCSPALERRNKPGREKFSAISNCSLHKTRFAKSISAALLQGLRYSHAKPGMLGATDLHLAAPAVPELVQHLHGALARVLSWCYWSTAAE